MKNLELALEKKLNDWYHSWKEVFILEKKFCWHHCKWC